MDYRYSQNIPAISSEEQAALKDKSVLVLGCGGLGGYIIENLLRMGVGRITAVDGDSFDETNLNRQLLSSSENIGCSKVEAAAQRARAVNPQAKFTAVGEFFTTENAAQLISGHDIVMDALDSADTRILLEDSCAALRVPIVHGAVGGWLLQAAVVRPGSGLLRTLYAGLPALDGKSVLPMTVQLCAAIQCAEAVKILCGRTPSLENRLLMGDLAQMQWEYVDF